MLDRVLRDPRVIAHHRASSLGPWLDELADGLLRRGYTRAVVDGYVRGVVHFGRWLELQGVGPSQIGEATVQRFLAHAPDCRCGVARGTPSDRRYGVPHIQEVLVRHGVIVAPQPARRPTPADRLVERFAVHLRDNRGMMASGCTEYSRIVRGFLSFRFRRAAIDLRRIRPLDLHRFVVGKAKKWRPATVQLASSALRRFLAFLQMRGIPTRGLADAIPRVPRWSLATIPKYLTHEQLGALLRSFDRATPLGRRDYAMTLCMARLGLRSGEVSSIDLEDFDWRGGTVRVMGKGRRQSMLPLPRDVSSAVVAYLRRGRPRTDCRRVFVTHIAPRGQPMSSRGVRTRVNYAFARAKVDCPSYGSHVLRHTAATHMIQAGVTLKEIADVPRHRELDTTTVSAKVDLVHLAEIAQPWPGHAS